MISLIIIISALALELYYESVDRFKGYGWVPKYRDLIIGFYRDSTRWNSTAGVLIVIAGPFLLLFILQSLMQHSGVVAHLMYLLLAIIVLAYSLRFHALESLIDQVSLHQGTKSEQEKNSQQAVLALANEADKKAEFDTNEILTKTVLVQSNERLFAVIFWFLLLGPAGALLYRMAQLLADAPLKSAASRVDPELNADPSSYNDDFDRNAQRLFGLMSWIPARISALGYALAGGFEDAIHNWREIDSEKTDKQGTYDFCRVNQAVLYQSGSGAIQLQRYNAPATPEDSKKRLSFDGVRAAQELVMRTLLIWMAVVVLVALTGWV